MWTQKQISLTPKNRGFHLVTREILGQLPELRDFKVGIAQIFLQHTSASLSINENADATVRSDMEAYFNQSVPDAAAYFKHLCEGPDDMSAHVKSSIIGCQLTIPVESGSLALGTWQGIYLGEHRNHAGRRNLLITLQGERW